MKRCAAIVISFLMVFVLAVPAFAAADGVPHVVDNAGVLTEDARKALDREALALSKRWEFDFVIVTVESLGSARPQAYADDFFDYNGYGYGERFDGILLLVSMEERDLAFSTCGYGITAFTDYGQEYMMNHVLEKLGKNDFEGGFKTFLSDGESLLKQAKNGKPLDVPKQAGGFPVISFIVCMGLGFVVAMMPVEDMKKQVKNVASQKAATNYVTGKGLDLSHQSDRFLYSRVTRRQRPKNNTSSSSSHSSGGSRTHVSSSGRTHGGSSGKF